MEKDSLFNKWRWENWTATCKTVKLDHFLIPYPKVKDLNVRQEAIKLLEKDTGSNLFDLRHDNFLLDMSLEAKKTTAKINYGDYIKIKSFFTVKKTTNKTKRQPTEWETIFANDISDKG